MKFCSVSITTFFAGPFGSYNTGVILQPSCETVALMFFSDQMITKT